MNLPIPIFRNEINALGDFKGGVKVARDFAAREAAQPPTVDRPWARSRPLRYEITPNIRRPSSPEATPPAEALEADD